MTFSAKSASSSFAESTPLTHAPSLLPPAAKFPDPSFFLLPSQSWKVALWLILHFWYSERSSLSNLPTLDARHIPLKATGAPPPHLLFITFHQPQHKRHRKAYSPRTVARRPALTLPQPPCLGRWAGPCEVLDAWERMRRQQEAEEAWLRLLQHLRSGWPTLPAYKAAPVFDGSAFTSQFSASFLEVAKTIICSLHLSPHK